MTATAAARTSGPDTRSWPLWARILTAPFSPTTWTAQVHVVADFVIGIFTFVTMTVAFSMLAAVACTIFGIPVVLWLTLLVARVIGGAERFRYRVLLDVTIPDPYPPFTGSFWDRAKQRLLSIHAWKEVVYSGVLCLMGTLGFTLTMALWSASLALALMPLYQRVLPDGVAHFGLFDVTGGSALMWGIAAVGVLGVFLAPWIVRGWVVLDLFVARTLLGRGVTAELEERVDVLQTSRSWALEVAEAERRRIERDLHDGAQQRLVALAMELGMAKEKLDTDPARARELVEQAHQDAKAAIAELRDLARGIHPADLGEAGLPGAIPVLAGRCAIPVEVHVSVPWRPAPSVEGIAYFFVSECLANVAKHAGATRASVRVEAIGNQLVVEVTDDGRGGASTESIGSGLRGLAERVRSVDGRFGVSSPVGGPTIVRAELPCGL